METEIKEVINSSTTDDRNMSADSMLTKYRTLFDISFPLAVTYVSIVLLLTVFGVLGNSFILYVMSREKALHDHAKSFMINIAVGDLCVSGIANPMCIVGAFVGMQYLNGDFWLCVVIASLCLTACICVFLNIVSLSLNRWLFICHKNIYERVYTNVSTKVICTACWVIGFGAEVPNFLSLNGHYFDPKSHQCTWNRTANRPYTLFVTIGLITMPFLLLGFCHVAVFRKIYKVKKTISTFHSRQKNAFMKSVKSAKTLLVIFFVFLICWMPYVTVLVLDRDDTFSMETHLFVILLAHAHSTAPCFIYLAFMKTFRDHLQMLVVRKNRVEPTSTDHTTPLRVNSEKRNAHFGIGIKPIDINMPSVHVETKTVELISI